MNELNTQMTRKTPIAAADLFVLLDREFQRRKRQCDACFVSLPFPVDRRSPEGPNWETILPAGCEARCDALLQEIVAGMQLTYELQEPG
jgi:hypothetical protein